MKISYPRNHWYPVYRSVELKNKPVLIKRFSRDFVLWRDSENRIQCSDNRCPHRGTSLAKGKIEGDCLRCPMHGISYHKSGRCHEIPANGSTAQIPQGFRLKKYDVREKSGIVWFWYGDENKVSESIPWRDEYTTYFPKHAWASYENSPVDFFRTMEANLDVAHFPWVHTQGAIYQFLLKNFPKLFKSLDIGPYVSPLDVQVNKEKQVIYMKWGLCHEKNGELLSKPLPLELWLHFPNQLFVRSNDWKTYGYFGCAPVDESRTFFVAGYSQGSCTVPYLGDFIAWYYLNHYVLGPITKQDLDLQITQPPGLGAGEDKLVLRADQGIYEYWNLYKEGSRSEQERRMISEVTHPITSSSEIFLENTQNTGFESE